MTQVKNVYLITPYTVLPGEKGFHRSPYIAENLANRGHNVTLVTSNFLHYDKDFRDKKKIAALSAELPYDIVLLDETGYKKNIGFDRIRSHNFLSKQLKGYLENLEKDPDVLYCTYPPMDTTSVVGKHAKKHGIPFMIDVIDTWPESIKSVVTLPDRLVDTVLYPLTIYANTIYNMADYVIGLSQSYVNRVEMANKKAKDYAPIYLGTDLGYFDQCKQQSIKKDPEEFWITYVGMVGHSHDLDTVIKSVALLKNEGIDNIVFKVAGAGPLLDKFKELANKLNAPVHFTGQMTYEEVVPLLANSEVAANALVKGAQQSITYKIADFVSAGLPVLNSSLNKEFVQLVKEYQIGFNYNPGDYKQLAELIKKLYNDRMLCKEMGNNARSLAEERFDRRNTYGRIYDMVEQATI
ncbi:glycosyltransferase family 4 protein [Halobacillus litoralis]|uniref:glycosyltransferase family 4 protein n=1 Tax=Halobacillus litoralis TaxID=45668 RepID=UPI001CFE9395|nr:glycosyltransferase family 4 protein [Halobacillus litoralis]